MDQDAADSDVIERAARELIGIGTSPIEAIKAIRSRYGESLGEAKALVHRNLSPERQRAAEMLWDEIEEVIRQEGDSPRDS